ncbi:MAG: hypothetical protein V3T88_03605 [Nitrosomonadaceae bacterium]
MALSGGIFGTGYMRAAPKSVAGGRQQLAAAAKNQLITAGSGGVSSGGVSGRGGGGSIPTTSTGGGTNTAYGDLYSSMLARLESGGLSLKADLATIEAGKRESIAAGEQNIVSSGLSGTTIMAGVPLAAEKTAGLQRLKARGTAEDKYLQALSNFANLAFQAEEGRLGRAATASNLQTSLTSRERTSGSSTYIPESERYAGGTGPGVAYGSTSPTIYNSNSEQFPTLYGQGGQLSDVPNWAA